MFNIPQTEEKSKEFCEKMFVKRSTKFRSVFRRLQCCQAAVGWLPNS